MSDDNSLTATAPFTGHAVVTDLDGTLVSCDTLADSMVALVARRPWMIFPVAFWMLHGRAELKARIAAARPYHADKSAFRQEVVDVLTQAKTSNHTVVLATASHQTTADAIADSLTFFDAVLASDGKVNLKGRLKAARIREWCSAMNISSFTYIGDSSADLPVWMEANDAVVVRPTPALESKIRAIGKPIAVIGHRRSFPSLSLRALRPHQWAKNLLVFVPMVLAQQVTWTAATRTLVAFLAFSLCASAVYVLNDILDAASDRKHPKKRFRPLASGDLSVPAALIIALGLLSTGLMLAMAIAFQCGLLLLGYLAANYLYSTWLKPKPLVDVIILSGMYGLRLEMGAVAAAVPMSPWLLAFSLFFFTSLAFAKRYVELRRMEAAGENKASGRGYQVGDLSLIESLGPASGYVAVLVLALYMNSEQMHAIYGEGRLLWLLCPLMLYWITRVWLYAKRGALDDDPVVFASRDRVSLMTAIITALIVGAATWMARIGR